MLLPQLWILCLTRHLKTMEINVRTIDIELNSYTWIEKLSKYAILLSGIVNISAILFFGDNLLFFVIFHCAFTLYGVYLIYDLLRWEGDVFYKNVCRNYDINSWIKTDKNFWMKRKWGVFEL